MADRFADAVVLITGAANGFGRRAAERFAASGAFVVLSDLDPRVMAVAEACGGAGLIADVAEEDSAAAQVALALDARGRIDVAINNAGIGHDLAPLSAIPVAEYDRVMAVNARSVFLGMKHQLPPMQAQGQGAIVNIASAAGLVGAGQLSAYAASKHAVIGLTRAAADETARDGVRVNALCPSFADTALFADMAGAVGDRHGLAPDAAGRRIARRIPMRRVAAVDEVVQAMLWMADPDNSFMTGQAIAIDGGLTAV